MSYESKYPDWKERVIEASETATSGADAARKLGVKYHTYKKYADIYGCTVSNQSGAGTNRNRKEDGTSKFNLEDILNGKHPQYRTYLLKHRLWNTGLKDKVCELCGITNMWNGKELQLQLDHIDGNNTNHNIDNLRIVCPNCHSQTDTFSGKNKI